MKSNFNLFFYGLGGLALKLVGVLVCFSSLFIFSYIGTWEGVGSLGLGVGVFLWGSSIRFDYQRRSGTLVHGGDGWR